MKFKILGLFLLAGMAAFAETRVFFHICVGGYAPAPVVAFAPPPPPPAAYVPVAPGPGYTWVAGYYYPVGPRYVWRAGYWARPPYAGAVLVGSRFVGRRFYGG